MTSQFKIHFHRYDPKTGESRLSAPTWHNAESFAAAFAHAEGMRYGMQEADPDRRFVVASIELTGLRGDECNGARLFETAKELSARVAAEQKG